MWNSGQPAPPAQNWGWPPNMSYQYNQDNAVDSSQSWAAAAALWAQQRQLQEQYQNAPPQPQENKPPEPPGPPPEQPGNHIQSNNEFPSHATGSEPSIEVHEYNHGQLNQSQQPEVIDYQHGKQANQMAPYSSESNVFDYNHGKDERTSENWNYNEMWQQQIMAGYYGEGNQEQWAQWNEHNDKGFHQNNEYSDHKDSQYNDLSKPDYKSSGSNKRHNKKQSNNFATFPVSQLSNHGSGSNSPDLAEIAKKSKGLPLWLRQGLQKMENDKVKQKEKDKKNEEMPNAKLVSGYQHHSPSPSPEVSEKEESGDERDVSSRNQKSSARNNFSRRSRFDKGRSPEGQRRRAESDESNNEEEEVDEEEKQRRLILKIKTWMTEILLGVTSSELRSLCDEVYYEMKRKAKVKATQLRRSGGLDALRSGDFDDETSSESEEEIIPPKPKPKVVTPEPSPKREPTPEPEPEPEPEPKKKIIPETTILTARLNEKKAALENKFFHRKEVTTVKRLSNSNAESPSKSKFKKSKRSQRSSSSDSSSESESDSSSDSEDRRKKKKSRRKRSESKSPVRRSNKKSKHRRRSSSSESDRSRKKKKHKYSDSSDDDSSYRKKKSKGKKQKHKSSRSVSRSPLRRPSKKKR